MITKKIWLLTTRPLTQADHIWITSNGCEYKIERHDPIPIETHGKTYHYMPGKDPDVFITTTCKKQESMLKLKYSDELVLQQVYHDILPTRTYFPDP